MTLSCAVSANSAMFKYNELMIKDYDEMLKLVRTQLNKAKGDDGYIGGAEGEDISDEEALEHLTEAMKLIFSRPNSDNMIAKLIPELRRELNSLNAFDQVLASLATEALRVSKDKKAAPSRQATALFMLENLLGELRPRAADNLAQRKIIEEIKKADVEISTATMKDMKLRGMFEAKNPSLLAEEILKTLPKPSKKSVTKPPPSNDEEAD